MARPGKFSERTAAPAGTRPTNGTTQHIDANWSQVVRDQRTHLFTPLLFLLLSNFLVFLLFFVFISDGKTPSMRYHQRTCKRGFFYQTLRHHLLDSFLTLTLTTLTKLPVHRMGLPALSGVFNTGAQCKRFQYVLHSFQPPHPPTPP